MGRSAQDSSKKAACVEVVQNEDRISSATVYFGLIGANSGLIVNSGHDDIL